MELNYIQRTDLAWARDTLKRMHSGPLGTRHARYVIDTLADLVDEYDRQQAARGDTWRARGVRRDREAARASTADIHAEWQRHICSTVFRDSDWTMADIAHAEAADADAHDSYIQAIEG